ncbi:MAG: alanine--glyoxylate aminotransferase family protein [Candidatus Binataceae bacterium]|nr:alanine--glyoxylate aminotransferase family protein [Candidatus Binataceae bacterium]
MVHPRVMRAMVAPVVGHLDPDFIAIMEGVKKLLRDLFQTANDLTFPVSGTGSAGMETAIANLIEPGDKAIVGVNGVFGGRLADCAERMGAAVNRIEAPWGEIIEPSKIAEALKQSKKTKLVAIVHAETSTGAWQPVEEISRIAHDHGAMLVLDAVTSLGCVPVEIDKWQVDVCYSCTQKGISAPPGLAPVTFSQAARDLIRSRKQKCRSWYFDVSMIEQYWGNERVYHHTAPITMIYALYEALRVLHDEGLEARFKRHRDNGAALNAGLAALGLEPAAQEGHRLPQLAVAKTLAGIDEAAVRRELLTRYNIEIAGGLGPFRGKVWRIGLLGESSRRQYVSALLAAIESIIASMGHEVRRGAAIAAADRVYESA